MCTEVGSGAEHLRLASADRAARGVAFAEHSDKLPTIRLLFFRVHHLVMVTVVITASSVSGRQRGPCHVLDCADGSSNGMCFSRPQPRAGAVTRLAPAPSALCGRVCAAVCAQLGPLFIPSWPHHVWLARAHVPQSPAKRHGTSTAFRLVLNLAVHKDSLVSYDGSYGGSHDGSYD